MVAIIGATGVAGSRHGLVARYYSNPEWTGAPVVEDRDQRITTDALDKRVMAIPGARSACALLPEAAPGVTRGESRRISA